MYMRRNLLRIDRLDMGRESLLYLTILSSTNYVSNRKYFVTMGLRSMKWDEWIGLFIHHPSFILDIVSRVVTNSD